VNIPKQCSVIVVVVRQTFKSQVNQRSWLLNLSFTNIIIIIIIITHKQINVAFSLVKQTSRTRNKIMLKVDMFSKQKTES